MDHEHHLCCVAAGTEDDKDVIVGRDYRFRGRGGIVVVFAGYTGHREGSLSSSFLGLGSVGWKDGDEACRCRDDASKEDGEGG